MEGKDRVRSFPTVSITAKHTTPGWKHRVGQAGFDDRGWSAAEAVAGPAGPVSQMMPPIQVIDTIVPLKMTCPKPGVFVFDMGQNFAAGPRFASRVRAARRSAALRRVALRQGHDQQGKPAKCQGRGYLYPEGRGGGGL